MRLLACIVLLAACGGGSSSKQPAPGARADFVDASGRPIGSATLHEMNDGVLIRASIALPGAEGYGFHVHQVGKCEPPFESAGSHFNPTGRKHGFLNPEGSHAGDLTNLPARDGKAPAVDVPGKGLALEGLFDADGSALVIHAKQDDYKTDPSGNSGARIACAVIRRPT